MSLVSAEYDDDDDDYSPPPPQPAEVKQDNTLKRRSTEILAPLESKKIKPVNTENTIYDRNNNRSLSNDGKDDDDELPPLPAAFASSIPKISITKSPPAPKTYDNDNVEMTDKKKSFLVPPQIWKKQANVSTEDTRSWTTEKLRKARKPPAVETM